MSQQLCLLVLATVADHTWAQVQYYENNTLMVPIWDLFATRKAAWANWTTQTTEPPLNWVEWHKRASILDDQMNKMTSTIATTVPTTTAFPLFSFNTDRIFNLSWEADQFRKDLDNEYELEANQSITMEPTPDPSYIPPSPRIFNPYRGVYINDSSFEKIYFNKTYYERFNRSINWAKKKAWWRNTPSTSTTEWPWINITKIGDWERLSLDLDDLSYWDSKRQKMEYEHHDYMENLKLLNRTPTTEQVTPLIKLLANTRIASLWKLHSILPYLNQKTTFHAPADHEMRDAIYSEEFPVSPVIMLEHDTGPTEYYAMENDYDYRDASKFLGERAREHEATKLWDERYFKQHFPADMATKRLEYPTPPDPYEEWQNMDTWRRREFILRGWNTVKYDFTETRASPWVWTAHPDPTTWDYYDYQDYTPLADYFDQMEKGTTRVDSREVSLIIWSEKQAFTTTDKGWTQEGETSQRRVKRKKVWTTARPKKSHQRRFNRTMSQQEIKRVMREKYRKINEAKERKMLEEKEETEMNKEEGADSQGVGGGDGVVDNYIPEETTTEFNVMYDFHNTPTTLEPLKQYQCHICLKQLSSKGGFARHIATHKRMGAYKDKFD